MLPNRLVVLLFAPGWRWSEVARKMDGATEALPLWLNARKSPCARVINAVDQWRASPIVKSFIQSNFIKTSLGNEQDKSYANLDHWHILLQLNGPPIISGRNHTNN
jgi:hypothetical protein